MIYTPSTSFFTSTRRNKERPSQTHLPTFDLLGFTHLAITGTRRFLFGHGVLQVMTFLRGLLVRHGLGFTSAVSRRTHDQGGFARIRQLRRVQSTTLLRLDGLSVLEFRRHGRHLTFPGCQRILFFTHKDRVTIGSEHDITKYIVQVERRRRPVGTLTATRRVFRGKHGVRHVVRVVLVADCVQELDACRQCLNLTFVMLVDRMSVQQKQAQKDFMVE